MCMPSLSSSDSRSLLKTAISMSRATLVSMSRWYSLSWFLSSSRRCWISSSLAPNYEYIMHHHYFVLPTFLLLFETPTILIDLCNLLTIKESNVA